MRYRCITCVTVALPILVFVLAIVYFCCKEMLLASTVLTLRLFGNWEARLGNAPIVGLHLREGERLLAYLTLHHDAIVSYRELAQQFWPAEATVHPEWAGGSFPSTRQAIYALRRALGEHAPRLVSVGKGMIRFDLEGADVDYAAFQELIAQDNREAWRQAQALYRGPLLEGWTEKWAQEARVRCQRSYERIVAALAAAPIEREEKEKRRKGEEEREDTRYKIQDTRPNTEHRTPTTSHQPPTTLLESNGGAVPLDLPFYIARETDGGFQQAIQRRDSIVLVKGTRQIGKTSLLARGLQGARQDGARVIFTDFSSLPSELLTSLDALYRILAQDIAYQLDLEADPEADWNTRRSPNRNLERFISDMALPEVGASLVWGMDEVDTLFQFPFGTEVFRLFRSWHNRRALDPRGSWSRLTLVMAYATEAHLFIQDVNQSPFNVGTRLALEDFTFAQVTELNVRYGKPLPDDAAVQRLYALLNGHPYLTRRALSEMQSRPVTIDTLEAQAGRNEGVFGDHLRRLFTSLTQNSELTDVVRGFLTGPFCASEDAFYRLRSAGLLAGEMPEECHWRCPLYAAYFKRYLK